MKLKILKDSRDGSFQGRDGESVEYFWTKARRVSDEVTLEFGGKQRYKAGEEVDLELEKQEIPGGYRYKAV